MQDKKQSHNFKEILGVGVAEILTISFFMSVGISILYKYGYYSTLGVEWYLSNLAPQYLVMSSLGLIANIFFTIGLGVVLSFRFRYLIENYIVQILFAFIFVVSTIFMISGFKIHYKLMTLFLVFTSTMYLIESIRLIINPSSVNSTNIETPKIKLNITFLSVFTLAMLIYSVISISYVPFFHGKDDIKNVLSGEVKLSSVELISGEKNWDLLEINGDKVFLINHENTKLFKIVEYKDIKQISVNQ